MLSNVVVALAVFLHALELPSMCKGQALQWQVNKTTEIIFGETEMELICSGTACCTGTVREWNGGPGSTTLMSNGVPSDSSKYEETLKSDSFSLVFKTLELTDVNAQYACSIDFASSTSTLLLPTADVFRYVPDVNNEIEIEKNVTESKINLRANLTRVFPEPVCTAKLKETDLTSSLTMTTNDNSPVKFTVIEMSNVPYQCSNIQEFLVISCKVGTIPFTVVNEEICVRTSTLIPTTKQPTDQKCFLTFIDTSEVNCVIIIIAVAVVIVVIVGVIIYYKVFYQKRHKENKEEMMLQQNQQLNYSKISNASKKCTAKENEEIVREGNKNQSISTQDDKKKNSGIYEKSVSKPNVPANTDKQLNETTQDSYTDM